MPVKWKGILLAGGNGTRLHPLTRAVNKHFLAVYNKPMIYYSLSTLMLAGLREIVVISHASDLPLFQQLLGDGSQWGLSLEYLRQEEPRGIAECFLIAEKALAGCSAALALGDNIFHSDRLQYRLQAALKKNEGATIFATEVADPRAFGVVEFDKAGRAVDIEEKPAAPRSNFAVTGLYFFDQSAPDIVRGMRPSVRGELEITDVIRAYLARDALRVVKFGRGFAWLDSGTPAALYDAGQFIKVVEERTGLLVASPDEIAFRRGYITRQQLISLASGNTSYDSYLRKIADT